jgi:hypothetical protein
MKKKTIVFVDFGILFRQNSERMLMTPKTFQKEARNHFKQPWSTPLGNHNYHRNTSYDHPEKTNQITDSAVKFKY